MRRLLVVTPGFHGYGASIADAFERIGYQASVHRYDAVSSPALKAWNKARYELPAKFTGGDQHQSPARVSALAIDALRRYRPDLVLVVRGDVLSQEFWAEAAAGGRPVVLWLYDEVRRTPRFDAGAVSTFARLATYSPLDAKALTAKGFETLYVPTAFDDLRRARPQSNAAGLLTFVGAPLPERERILRMLDRAQLPVRAWGRGWSDHPLDRARTWRLRGRGVPSERDVPAEESLAIMRDSAATLNVHGDQDGFTMRTFESCGVGGVQLIDRADVAEFYEPGSEVLVFTSDDELVDHARHVLRRPEDFTQLREAAERRTRSEHTFVRRARILEQLWA